MGACSGIRVVEISRRFGVAALCGQLLAGLGAHVRAVCPEDADSNTNVRSESYLSSLLHAHKEVIRPKSPMTHLDRSLGELIEWADVLLVDSGTVNPDGLFTHLREFAQRWPRKILCVISLCGIDSAHPDWTGNELIAEAAGGLMACNGYPERPPVSSGLPYALHTTALLGFNAVMTALWEKDSSGLGQTIDLAIIDCIVALLGNFLPSYFLSGRSPQRIGNRHTIAAPWNLYPAADGSVVICTGTGGTGWWAKVMAVLERPDLIQDPRYITEADRVRNVEQVDAIISEWTRQRTMADIVERMTRQGIPVSEISTLEAVLADPHYRDLRRMIVAPEVSSANEPPLPLVGNPLKVGDWLHLRPTPSAPMGAASQTPPNDASARGRGVPFGQGPLAGIRVLEFASRTSAPLAGRLMADLGAEVVKIEPGKGDALRGAGQRVGESSYLFHINNAGKQSVVIEPTDSRGRELILELVRKADVFVENLAPGSLRKMGLGYEQLQAANPQLIYCSVNGFGERSNYGSKRALDTVVQAACGLMHMTGYPDHFPVKLGISAIDLTTATAVMAAVLAALRERLHTHTGTHIDLAMADVGVWMTQRFWPLILCEGRHPIRQGNRSSKDSPHNIFPAQDGHFVAVAVETDAQWNALHALLNSPRLSALKQANTDERIRQRDLIEEVIADWCSAFAAADVASHCQARGVPAATVKDLPSVVQDPDVIKRRMIVSVRHPAAGAMQLLGNPLALSRTPPAVRHAAPILGQHTREVLDRWLSLPADQLQSLLATGTIITREVPPSTRAATVAAPVA